MQAWKSPSIEKNDSKSFREYLEPFKTYNTIKKHLVSRKLPETLSNRTATYHWHPRIIPTNGQPSLSRWWTQNMDPRILIVANILLIGEYQPSDSCTWGPWHILRQGHLDPPFTDCIRQPERRPYCFEFVLTIGNCDLMSACQVYTDDVNFLETTEL